MKIGKIIYIANRASKVSQVGTCSACYLVWVEATDVCGDCSVKLCNADRHRKYDASIVKGHR